MGRVLIIGAGGQHQQQAFDFVCMRFGFFSLDFRSNGVALRMEMGTGKKRYLRYLLKVIS